MTRTISNNNFFSLLLLLLILCISYSFTFFQVPVVQRQHCPYNQVLYAKKKKKNTKVPKGFGKVETPKPTSKPVQEDISSTSIPTSSGIETTTSSSSPFLQSVENGSTEKPTIDESSNKPAEERAAAILREKYGMKTLAEQQLDTKQLELRKEQQKKWAEMKRKAELNEDFDLIAMLPAPVLIFIDRFLKGGLALCSILFILGGIGITLEAWSVTSGNPLPENIDTLIVNVVEPNFTPGLLVLLGFSVSLGVFAALQLGSSGATYRED